MSYLLQRDKVVLSQVLREIEDASLQLIIRSIVFEQEDALVAIKKHRPETTEEELSRLKTT